MPLFDISINILWFLICIGVSAWFGFAFRSLQLGKKNRRIAELENEMLDLNAEILALQKECCELSARIQQLTIPVIPMKPAGKEDAIEKTEMKPAEALKKKRSDRSA